MMDYGSGTSDDEGTLRTASPPNICGFCVGARIARPSLVGAARTPSVTFGDSSLRREPWNDEGVVGYKRGKGRSPKKRGS